MVATSLPEETRRARMRRITSTRAPAICGCDQRTQEHGVARQILGIDDEVEVTGPMERGVFLEDGVANWFLHRMRQQKQRSFQILSPPFKVHPEHDWLGTSLDRLLLENSKIVGGLECKNYLSDKRYDYGEQWTDEVDERTLVQCVVHMACHDLPLVFVPLADFDLRIYVVERDLELERGVIFKCERFWDEWIAPNLDRLANGAGALDLVLPPLDGTDDTSEWIKGQYQQKRGALLEATDETEALAHDLLIARERQAELAEQKAALENRMKAAIGDAAGISYGDDGFVTWRANKNGVRSFRFKFRGGGEES